LDTPQTPPALPALIKAAMVLHREQIPATLHFKNPIRKLISPIVPL